MLADKFKPPTKTDILLVIYVTMGGLVGGVVLSILEGGLNLTNILMGPIAAFVGVVIFNIDRSDWHRLVVAAVLCGLSWQSVMDTGKQFLNVKMAESSTERAQELVAKLPEAPEGDLSNQITAAAESASVAVTETAHLKNSAVQTRITSDITGVVTKLDDLAPKEPEAVVDALTTLGKSAGKSGNLKVWRLSAQSLQNIAANPRFSPAVRASAVQAYEAVKVKE